MKIVIINGSARKGNTLTAINAFIKGASEKNEIEIISPEKLHIAFCKGCGACQCYKGCVDKDDTNQGTLKRIKKKSFAWYKQVIASHGEDLD